MNRITNTLRFSIRELLLICALLATIFALLMQRHAPTPFANAMVSEATIVEEICEELGISANCHSLGSMSSLLSANYWGAFDGSAGRRVSQFYVDTTVDEFQTVLMPKFQERLKKMLLESCLLYTSPSPRDGLLSRMPSSA